MIQIGNTIQHRYQYGETMGDNGETRHPKTDTPSSTGTHVGRQWETMKRNRRQRETGRQEGRQWEAIGWAMGENGRQVETRPWGSRQTIRHRLTCEETMGDKGRQDVEKADTPSNKGKQEGRWETRGNKTLGRWTHHPTQADKRRQDRGKADTPRLRHHQRQAHMWGDNEREWGTMGDTWRPGRQDLEKAGTPSKKGKQEGRWETMEDDKERQDLGKADTPSNTNVYCRETMGDKRRQGETRPREGGNAIRQTKHHRHTCEE